MTKLMSATLVILMSLGAMAQEAVCPQGHSDRNGRKFCTECGSPMADVARRNTTPVSDGFKEIQSQRGGGTILMNLAAQGRSGRALLEETLEILSVRLGTRARLQQAIATRNNKGVEGHFRAGNVQGLIIVDLTGKNGLVTVIYDRAGKFADSMARLLDTAEKSLPAGRKAVRWQNVNLPAGTGTARLPQGWMVRNSQEGALCAEGGEGLVDLGAWCQAYTPEAAAQLWMRPPLVASYGNAGHTLQDLFPTMSTMLEQQGFPAIQWGRTIDRAPADFMGGASEFLHYEFIRGRGRQAETWQSLALVSTKPVGDGTIFIYMSTIAAPAKSFGSNLETLLEVWGSWKVSDKVFAERLKRAMKSMEEANKSIQEAITYRTEVFDAANEKWNRYIRGSSPAVNNETGEEMEIPNDISPDQMDEFNKKNGTDWQVIPPGKK